ncbi:MAG: hypothetical protein J6S21_05220, partial [Victivallales bacterium]|nr:hypothetical protein [Victivallales bacterium]
ALVGVLPALSVADWSSIPWLHKALTACFGEALIPGNFFDLLDLLTSNWILPVNGFFICLFVGWIWGTRKASDELRQGPNPLVDANIFVNLAGLHKEKNYLPALNSGVTIMTLWCVLTRFLAPAIILVIFMNAIGLGD